MAGQDIVTLSDASFGQEVLQSGQPVLVDFWAPWCGPCRMIGPVVEELATTYKAKLKVGKVNVDDNQQVATQYDIRSIPTLLVFKGGKVVDQLMGAVPRDRIINMLEKHF